MAEELEWRRAEYGISYWSIESDAWETLARSWPSWPARDASPPAHGWEADRHARARSAASASSPLTRRPSAPSATSPCWCCTASRPRRSTTPPCSTACAPGGASCSSTCSGYGLSAKPDRAYPMALQADVAAAFVAALGIERLALLTHDMGDTVGGELLARRAEGTWPVEVTRRVVTNGSIYIDAGAPDQTASRSCSGCPTRCCAGRSRSTPPPSRGACARRSAR